MQALLRADGRKELAQLGGAGCCAPLAGAEISPRDAEAAANLFKALADPTRVRLVNMLANSPQPVCVCELNAHFDLGQPTISHHLKKLVRAGLLKREQRGTWAFFSLDNESLQRLTDMTKPRGVKDE